MYPRDYYAEAIAALKRAHELTNGNAEARAEIANAADALREIAEVYGIETEDDDESETA